MLKMSVFKKKKKKSLSVKGNTNSSPVFLSLHNLLCLQDRVSLYSSNWPQTQNPLVSTSKVLAVQARKYHHAHILAFYFSNIIYLETGLLYIALAAS